MNKYKLHQWLTLLLALVIFAGCSKKNFPSNNAADNEALSQNEKKAIDEYIPPPVIYITDELAKSNKEGEMYYDNEYGYRYWKFCDGKYYLDAKYESGAKPDKKLAKKSTKKQNKQRSDRSEENGYVNQ